MGLAFHPSRPFFAASLISGGVQIFTARGSSPGASAYSLHHTLQHHTESARAVAFNTCGSAFLSASCDRSIRAYASESCQSSWIASAAHPAPLQVLLANIAAQRDLVISGDEDGGMRLWDVRQRGDKALQACAAHEDYISDISYDVAHERVLSVGGDGRLCVFELRKGKVKEERKSDEQEHELLCVEVVKRGRKVVVGAQDGVLNLWSWGTWGDLSDRFPGHPESIDAMLKVDEDTVCTGSSDGILRFVNILPNKLIGVAGDHGGFPIERMAFSHDRASIGKLSHQLVEIASGQGLSGLRVVSVLPNV